MCIEKTDYWLERVGQEEGKGEKARPKDGMGGSPGGAVVKNTPANAGDTGSSPGPGISHMLQSN